MQSQPTHGDEQDAIEFAVLSHLTHSYPVQFTVKEAVRELAVGSFPGATPVGVTDAIRALIRTGLLREHGACVVPTRPTLRLFELVG